MLVYTECDELPLPASTEHIEAAFGHVAGSTEVELNNRSTSIKMLEWERTHAVLAGTDFHISEAAPAGDAQANAGASPRSSG